MATRRSVLAEQQHSQHNRSMASITVRDVPDSTRDELAARAARSGRSMQEYLRMQLIELAGSVDTDELLARVRARKEQTRSRLPAKEILAAKDQDLR